MAIFHVIAGLLRGEVRSLRRAKYLHDLVSWNPNGDYSPANLRRRKYLLRVEYEVIFIGGNAGNLLRTDHASHVDPEQVHQTLHRQVCGLAGQQKLHPQGVWDPDRGRLRGVADRLHPCRQIRARSGTTHCTRQWDSFPPRDFPEEYPGICVPRFDTVLEKTPGPPPKNRANGMGLLPVLCPVNVPPPR